MKKILLLSFLIISIVAVQAQDQRLSKKEKKAQRKAMLTEQTKEIIEANTWQFDAIRMLPTTGKARNLTTNYSVVLKDNEVDSYLPYFGRAYSADYGSSDSPMTFKSKIEDLSVEDGKKGGYIIKFTAKNKNDRVDFTFSVGSTGSTSLSVSSTNRQHISYQGDLIPIEEKK
ncbi:DUF4251 domain-containing protein [Draconibacterium sp. IB214405]|uniref:DUF4251 domain-containing protein n=1 Tax=Draconibacterium sp. IB214405 TaxID=3097352 RepID=UPI002A0D9FA0|nr:DUF4251 domain-containing protein [Draconibacterium sp. IB214405]MDX8339679.1 DUF4251 domain-containing protein [Draconibacterium sp. IB214405]